MLPDSPIDPYALSRRLQAGDGVTSAEMNALYGRLNDAQVQRIRDKQQWEHRSALGVLSDWPSLFDPGASGV